MKRRKTTAIMVKITFRIFIRLNITGLLSFLNRANGMAANASIATIAANILIYSGFSLYFNKVETGLMKTKTRITNSNEEVNKLIKAVEYTFS